MAALLKLEIKASEIREDIEAWEQVDVKGPFALVYPVGYYCDIKGDDFDISHHIVETVKDVDCALWYLEPVVKEAVGFETFLRKLNAVRAKKPSPQSPDFVISKADGDVKSGSFVGTDNHRIDRVTGENAVICCVCGQTALKGVVRKESVQVDGQSWDCISCDQCNAGPISSDVAEYKAKMGVHPSVANAIRDHIARQPVGIKHDTGKRRYDLIPERAEQAVVDVFTFGAETYGERNWERLERLPDRCYAACRRHLAEWRSGVARDGKTGLHHLAHAIVNLTFILEMELRNAKKTDAK